MTYYTIHAIHKEYSKGLSEVQFGSYDKQDVIEEIQDMKESGEYTNITIINTEDK